MEKNVPVIFEAVFEVTLTMITKNFEVISYALLECTSYLRNRFQEESPRHLRGRLRSHTHHDHQKRRGNFMRTIDQRIIFYALLD